MNLNETIEEPPLFSKEEVEVLVCQFGQEKFAIETKFIKEVSPLKSYTPLPGVPSFIFGIVNIKRKILSIFDLKAFFGLPPGKTENSQLVILEFGEMELALLTDGIYDIQAIGLSQVQSLLPPILLDGMEEFLLTAIPQKNEQKTESEISGGLICNERIARASNEEINNLDDSPNIANLKIKTTEKFLLLNVQKLLASQQIIVDDNVDGL